jgi:hypothetical protein
VARALAARAGHRVVFLPLARLKTVDDLCERAHAVLLVRQRRPRAKPGLLRGLGEQPLEPADRLLMSLARLELDRREGTPGVADALRLLRKRTRRSHGVVHVLARRLSEDLQRTHPRRFDG